LTQTALAVLSGKFASAQFSLVSPSGSVIQTIPLAQGVEHADPDNFIGTFVLPPQPFRVIATGVDAAGVNFQRVYPTLFAGSTVSVTATNTFDSLKPGVAASLTYNVSNLGLATETFQISASNDASVFASVNPSTLTLTAGDSAPVSLSVTIPSGTPLGTAVEFVVTAASTTDPALRNSAVQGLSVADVVIDTVSPVITVAASKVRPPRGRDLMLAVSGTVADSGGSGLDLSSPGYAIVDDVGNIRKTGSFAAAADGTYSFIVTVPRLEDSHIATKKIDGDDGRRRLTVSVFAADNAGNVGAGSATVVKRDTD
jgi:hypothetical protein